MIFADALSKFFFGGGDVENVVDDLEGEAERLTKLSERAKLVGASPSGHGAEAKRGGDEGAGFRAMNLDQLFQGDAFFF